MPVSVVYRFSGPTVSPTITTVATGQVSVTSFPGESPYHAAFLNTGPTLIAVAIGSGGPAPVASFPGSSNTAAPVFILPALMTQPLVVNTPSTPFNFTALTNSSVAPTLFVTPVTGT